MKVKVASTIRSPVEIGRERHVDYINRKSAQWKKYTREILRTDHNAAKMSEDVSTEVWRDGFTGIIDNPAAMGFEFGIDEVIVDGGVDTAITPELAPMRRALAKL